MSVKNIVEEVVKMTFDNAGFEKNIKESQKSIEDLRNSINMDGSAKALSIIQNSVDQLNGRFSALGIAGMTAIQNITNKAINMATELSRSFSNNFLKGPFDQGFGEYELKMGSIQTIMASTGASLEDVNGYLEELNHYADKTIYSFSDMTSNIGKFTNAGVELNTAVKAIQGISNEAAISGANANEASRAMYNFAQALSAGYVKLIDWKSIENANMATKEFKQELIDTAVKLGTVVKVGEDYQTVTKDNNGKVSQLFNSTKNFNDALSAQWMTTDVLTTTLAKYADETTDIGKKAFSAAQDVKTFSQLIDTVKEAIGSGWSKTFELIIGDFDQAKALFTSINNVVSSFVDNVSDARNNLLEAALGPKKIAEEVLTSGENAGDAKTKLEDYEKVAKEIAAGKWGNGQERIDKLTAAGYNYDAVMMLVNRDLIGAEFNMDKFTKAVGAATTATEELTDANSKTGRELLIESLANVAKNAGKVFESVGKAYRSIFPPMTAERLRELIENFHDFTERMMLSEKTSNNLANTFKIFFGVIKMITNALSALGRVVAPIVSAGRDFLGNFLDKIGAPLGIFVSDIARAAERTDFFFKVLDAFRQIGGFIFTNIANGVKEFLSAIGITLPEAGAFSNILRTVKLNVISFMESFDNTSIISKFCGLLGRIKNFIAPVSELFEKATKKVVNFFKGFISKDADEAEKKVNIFSSLFERIKERLKPLGGLIDGIKHIFSSLFDLLKKSVPSISKLGGALATGLTTLLNKIADGISNFNFDKAFDLLNTGIFTGILLSISKFAKGLKSAGDKLSFSGIFDKFKEGPFGDIVKMLDSVREAIGAWTANIKSKTLRNIAVSVAILAAALIALTLVDSDKLTVALGMITALFAELVASMTALDKLTGNNKRIKTLSSVLVALSAAVLILSLSLKVLAGIDGESLMRGILGLGAVMAELFLFIYGLDKLEINTKKITGIIGLAVGMRILVSSVKALAELDTDGLVNGIAALGGLFLELGAFMAIVSSSENKFGVNQGLAVIAVALAIKIMVGAINKFASMDTMGLIKGLATMGYLLLEIGAFSAIIAKANFGLRNGLGLIAMAGALAIFAVVLKSLGKMSLKSIGKGLIAIGGGLLAMALAAKAMSGSLKGALAMTIMSVALIAMAGAIKLLGTMNLDQVLVALIAMAGTFVIFGLAGMALAPLTGVLLALSGALLLFGVAVAAIGAGVLALGLGLASLAGSGAAAAASLQVILASILGLVPLFFKQLALGIVEFLGVIEDSAGALSQTFVTLVTAACAALSETIPTIVDTAIELLNTVLDKLLEEAPTITGKLVDLLVSLIKTVTDKADDIINTVIDLVIKIIDTLTSRVSELTDSLGGLIEALFKSIGNLVGSAVSGLISGIAEGASESMEKLSKTLGTFMDNADGFFEAVKVIDNESVQGVVNLVKVIMALTKAEVIDKLTFWKSNTTLSDFGDKLVEFGPKFAKYADSVKDIDYGVVTKSTTLMSALVALSREIPNTGGFFTLFTGDNSIDDFGRRIVKFGYCMKVYGERVKDVNSLIISKTSMAMSTLVALAREIPDTGGFFTLFTGDNSIDDFGKRIVKFGFCFKRYSEIVKGVDATMVANTTSVMDALVELSRDIPNSGGLITLFTGDNTFSGFGEQLEGFAEHFVKYSDLLKGMNWVSIYRVPQFINSLLDAADNIANNNNVNAINEFGTNMARFASDGIASFVNAIDNSATELQGAADTIATVLTDELLSSENIDKYHDAGYDAITKFNGGINDKAPDVKNRINTDVITTAISAINSRKWEFSAAGRIVIGEFIDGMGSRGQNARNAAYRVGNNAAYGLNDARGGAYNAGRNVAYGFADGMYSLFNYVYNTAYNMGISAVNGARRALRVMSPSRVFMQIGEYTGEGLVIGMQDQYGSVEDASAGMGKTALDSMAEMMNRVKMLLDGTDEFNPTITPVLDLSKIQQGVGQIDGMFNTPHLAIPGTKVLGDLNTTSANIDIKDQIRQGVLEAFNSMPNAATNETNNIYINGADSDPNEIADAVIDKLNLRYNQRRAVFG